MGTGWSVPVGGGAPGCDRDGDDGDSEHQEYAAYDQRGDRPVAVRNVPGEGAGARRDTRDVAGRADADEQRRVWGRRSVTDQDLRRTLETPDNDRSCQNHAHEPPSRRRDPGTACGRRIGRRPPRSPIGDFKRSSVGYSQSVRTFSARVLSARTTGRPARCQPTRHRRSAGVR
jgi:hypothetical protein